MKIRTALYFRVPTAGMQAAKSHGKHLGRLRIPARVVAKIKGLAGTTDLSMRHIRGKVGHGVAGDLEKRYRA